MYVSVILPAAGSGRRFDEQSDDQADERLDAGPKLEQRLGDQPVFWHAVGAFSKRAEVGQVLVAVKPEQLDAFRFKWADRLSLMEVQVIAGGRADRWQTVGKALEHVDDQTTHVAIHDAARPLVSQALIDRVFDAATDYSALIPGLPVANTLKRVTEEGSTPGTDVPTAGNDPAGAIPGTSAPPHAPSTNLQRVVQTVPRHDLVEVQTPQMFEVALIRRAYAQIGTDQIDPTHITDDAALIEALGEAVYVVQGQSTNLKITRRADLDMARALLTQWDARNAGQQAAKRLFAADDEEE